MTKVEIEVVVDVPYASYREDSRETMTVREDRFWAFTLAVTFGFSAGYVDANTKRRFATFGSLMTGNAVQLGTAAAGGDWHEAALCASTFVAFDVGLMVTSHIIHLATRDSSRESLVSPKPHGSRDGAGLDRRALPAAVRFWAAVLICVGLVSCDALQAVLTPISFDQRFAGAFAAFAMGVQNVCTLKGALHQNTSLLGGSMQQLAFVTYRWLIGTANSEELNEAAESFVVFLGYLAGAAAGAASLWVIGHEWSLWPVAVFIAGGLWLTPRIPVARR